VRRLLIGGSPFQGRYPASEVNDGTCPEKPDHLMLMWSVLAGQATLSFAVPDHRNLDQRQCQRHLWVQGQACQ
jgi:hypothetical protein